MFQEECVKQLRLNPPTLKTNDWKKLTNILLTNAEITEPAEGTSTKDILRNYLEDYCVNRIQKDDYEDNIMACVLAEKHKPSKRTIAIINKHNYSLLQESLKIDDLVDPRMATVSTIMKHVHMGTIDTVYSLLDGEYEFLEAKILESSELANKSIKDSNLPDEIRIGAAVRKGKVIIPRSNYIFEKDDLIVFLAKREHLKEVENIFSVSSI